MRACGNDDPAAFRAALQVQMLRHPERGFEACRLDASQWIAHAVERPH